MIVRVTNSDVPAPRNARKYVWFGLMGFVLTDGGAGEMIEGGWIRHFSKNSKRQRITEEAGVDFWFKWSKSDNV